MSLGEREAPPARGGFLHSLRAGYGDTDQSGVVHHAVYLRWLEDARVAFFRERGMDFRDLELERRIGMAVARAEQRYLLPARFDDCLDVEVFIGKLGRAQIRVDYRVWRESDLLMESKVTLALIDLERMRAIRLPEDVVAVVSA